jgi:uncharacterized protein YcsI (UPF0317 family)
MVSDITSSRYPVISVNYGESLYRSSYEGIEYMAAQKVLDRTKIAHLSGSEARAFIRAGDWRGTTTGMAHGWAQANLVILPHSYAEHFLSFCRLNPQACPVLDVTEPGSSEPLQVAPGADLRVDIPRYRVYRDGVFVEEVETITPLWSTNLVSFLLGCSFTVEAALLRAGLPLRHLEVGRIVSMYRTNRACHAAGPFHGPLVVSMRPIPKGLVDHAISITERFPKAHGAPVHVGNPSELGISDLSRPDYGDPVPIHPGDVPVFWACGVTPQAAAQAAKIELMITHAPGHMFVTDIRDEDLANG